MRNNEQSTFAHTIAYRNPTVANEFCIQAGLGPSRTPDEVAWKLNQYIARHGDPAVDALKEIHPDYELFKPEVPAAAMNEVAPQNRNMNAGAYHNCCGMAANGYSNCSGCGGACQSRSYMNANGPGGEKIRPMGLIDSNQLTIVGIFAITALLIYAMSPMAAKKG